MMKIAVCDDDDAIVRCLSNYISNICNEVHVDVEIEPYHSAKNLIAKFAPKDSYDIIFMDIEIDEVNGIEAARRLRALGMDTILIFVSSYDKYLMELFEVEPFRFIKKPVQAEEFRKIFMKAIERVQKTNGFFEFKQKHQIGRIPYRDILYFESQQRQIILHTLQGSMTFYGKLNDVEECVKEKTMFLRIHQSFLINFMFVKSFQMKQVVLLNNVTLNVSEDRQRKVKDQYFFLLQSDYLHKEGSNHVKSKYK